jgi:hypothetical protein
MKKIPRNVKISLVSGENIFDLGEKREIIEESQSL